MANKKISLLNSITTPVSDDILPIVNESITKKINLGQLQNFMAIVCRLATTVNIDLTTGGLITIDDVNTVAGNRILVWQQTNAIENGIYTVLEGSWVRAANFNKTRNMIPGELIPVLEGGVYASTIFQHSTRSGFTLGTTNISFLPIVSRLNNTDEAINRSYTQLRKKTNLSAGWYTIATNAGNRAIAKFGIWDETQHQTVIFYASHLFGKDTANVLTVLHHSTFLVPPVKTIRIKSGIIGEGSALQVYIDDVENKVSTAVLGENFQTSGWVLRDWIPDANDPGDVTNYSTFVESSKIDISLLNDGSMVSTGSIYAEGATEQSKVLTFNDTSDAINLDDSNSLATSKAVKVLNDSKEQAFNKNSAFNKNFGSGSNEVPYGNHIHDERYYTETEIDTQLANKANSTHTHTPSQVGLGNLPNAKSDSTTSTNSNVLATSKAVNDARNSASNWNNLSSKPSTFPPSTHSHSWSSITSKPSTFNPSTHTHTPSQVGLGNLPNAKSDSITSTNSNVLATSKAVNDAHNSARNWNNISSKPSTFPPSTHSHSWSSITSKPSSFNPSTHTHTPSQVGLGNLPNAKSDSITSTNSNVLATSKAVNDARNSARDWNNLSNKPNGINATRRVKDESGSTETVTIVNGIITAWGNVVQQVTQQAAQQITVQQVAPISQIIPRFTEERQFIDSSQLSCIAIDTAILMANGSSKSLEIIEVGDEVKSFNIASLTETNYKTWNGTLGEFKKATSKVISKTLYNVESYILINDKLKVAGSTECILCRKAGNRVWQFVTADELKTGDFLVNAALEEQQIETIRLVDEPIDVGLIKMEPHGLFLGEGFVIFNTED